MTVKKGAGAKGTPMVKTPAQRAAEEKRLIGAAQQAAAEKAQTEAQAAAARLAQIVNLHIAGFSLSDIGAQIGATADEVDRMLANDMQRYVRSQPALRTYVRNWISGKYTAMLEADWEAASDKDHREKLEHQDRVMRILAGMERLHGAAAPTQTEVKVEAAPEAVERLVAALSAQNGVGYDTSIFDVIDVEEVTEAVHDVTQESLAALERASSEVEKPQPEDGEF